MNDIVSVELFNKYKKSVYDLADKLPQWSSEQFDRRVKASISSLFEEAGEISGLFSKYCTRTNKHGIDFYNTSVSALPLDTYAEIREKFIDEASDFLWVLTASCHVLANEGVGLLAQFTKAKEDVINDQHTTFDSSLFDIFGAIFVMYSSTHFNDKSFMNCLSDIAYSFGVFLAMLENRYEITLENLIEHNMEKLGFRYDSDGKRVDGK